MKIFIALTNKEVSNRLGKAEEFAIYTLENRVLINKEIVKNLGKDSEQICAFLIENNCDILAVGGIGEKALRILSMTGIRIGINAKGNPDTLVENLINDTTFDLTTEANHLESSCGCGCGCGHHHHHEEHCCCHSETECCEGDCCEEEHTCCCSHHE